MQVKLPLPGGRGSPEIVAFPAVRGISDPVACLPQPAVVPLRGNLNRSDAAERRRHKTDSPLVQHMKERGGSTELPVASPHDSPYHSHQRLLNSHLSTFGPSHRRFLPDVLPIHAIRRFASHFRGRH